MFTLKKKKKKKDFITNYLFKRLSCSTPCFPARPFNACLRHCDFAIPEYILALWRSRELLQNASNLPVLLTWTGLQEKLSAPSTNSKHDSYNSQGKMLSEIDRKTMISLNFLTVVARSPAGILGLCFVSAFASFSTVSYVHNSRDEGVRKPPNKQISRQPLGRDSRQRHHQARNILGPGKKREVLW